MNPFRIRGILVRCPGILRYTIVNIPSGSENRTVGTVIGVASNTPRSGRLRGGVGAFYGGHVTDCG